jgi:ABC-2 type transport system ATP-binding protein
MTYVVEVSVIHVSNLTKFYGDYAAIRDVSFDVPSGQIVGFLGPNGAGKTTTMRILAGFLTANSGQATMVSTSSGNPSRPAAV